jgi:hypothetical protein
MIEAGLAAAGRNGEIDARIVQQPLRTVGLGNGRFGGKERAVEPNGLDNVLNGHMDMQALHWWVFSFLALMRVEESQTPTPPDATP